MWNLYTDCFEMPLGNYIDICTLNKYNRYKKRRYIISTKSGILIAAKKFQESLLIVSENEKSKRIDLLRERYKKLNNDIKILILVEKILICRDSEECRKWLKKNFYLADNREQALKSIKNAIFLKEQDIKEAKSQLENLFDNKNQLQTKKEDMIMMIQVLNETVKSNLTMKSSVADFLIASKRLSLKVKNIKDGK